MPPVMWPNPVSDAQYIQLIRRHKPSSLLPKLAIEACKYRTPEQWLASPFRIYTPWALADVARVSLSHGTEFQRRDISDSELTEILAAFDALRDPFLRDNDLHAYLLRKAGEQFSWQTSEFHAMARTIALFLHTAAQQPMKCVTQGWDSQLFGFPLRDYIGTAQLLWASAISCSGYFDPQFFETADGQLATKHVPAETVLAITEGHFATDKARFRAEDDLVAKRMIGGDQQLRRYTFNPLRSKPLLRGYGEGYLCPVPQIIAGKAGPLGVYFSGLNYFGEQFIADLGHLFEQYIGRHLALIKDAAVIPEIVFTANKSEARSVDWILIFDKLVLLIEVKSAIPTEPVRLGTSDAAVEITRKIKRAFEQIDLTAARIRAGHAAFRAIPGNRQILGMAVTLEPFHLANHPQLRQLLPPTDINTSLVDAADIESLVTLNDTSIAQFLLDRDADPERSTWPIIDCLKGHGRDRNPVLDVAWEATPWSSANRKDRQI